MSKTVGGTKEWAASNVNIQIGCSHGCLYCYAMASAVRFGRADPGDWTTERIQESLAAKNFGKRKGTIMFPTTHDITPANLEYSVAILKRMLEPGNSVLIVSKPHIDCISRLCGELWDWKDQVLFRFTIGSMNEATLKFWEPGAPSFEERMFSLRHAHDSGFATSVSMEPLLELHEDQVVWTVDMLAEYVTDAIWIGKANRLTERLKRNGHVRSDIMGAASALLASQTDARILALYERLKDHPKVKWKESIKSVVGLEIPTEAGLDI